jgi:pyruvate/2-oxoglutarate dehydrogenase complex dihydrolipoamide acyltransferase (E2) component
MCTALPTEESLMAEVTEIKIPHSGSVENVEINDWLIEVGAVVDEGQPIADVSTDKADTELEAPAAGRVVKFLVDAGTEVKVGTAVALLVDAGATDDEIADAVAAYVPSADE